MQRYFATIEYDGTQYFGFQRQEKKQITIQGCLEDVLQKILGVSITIIGSGRTDSGVHATGQVISFDCVWHHPVSSLQKAINAYLPKDITVVHLRSVPFSAHVRFSAIRRKYIYYIYNSQIRSSLWRSHCWHVSQSLDIHVMQLASNYLIGIQDFSTFGKPPQGISCVREVFEATWRQSHPQMLTFEIEANAFLYRMVRSIVGSLRLVGGGSWTVADFVNALNGRDRSLSGPSAPAHGLYLASVTYKDLGEF